MVFNGILIVKSLSKRIDIVPITTPGFFVVVELTSCMRMDSPCGNGHNVSGSYFAILNRASYFERIMQSVLDLSNSSLNEYLFINISILVKMRRKLLSSKIPYV